MKLQSNIFLLVLNKYKYWLFSFLFLFIISYILIRINSEVTEYEFYFLDLIAHPKRELSFFNIYQIILYAFLINRFFFYDLTYMQDYVLLRIKDRKWLINKIIIGILGTILFKSILIGITYFLFRNKINFEVSYLIYPNAYLLIILFGQVFNLNFRKEIQIIFIILEIPLLIFLFINFSLKLIIILFLISLVLIFFTILNFKLKKVIK